ncbi:hypothetical protein LZ30DRAFT_45583 [Colletotrichum cereale]|nr:hypothetical protein LZ30DRAFT_45583 [Colletotrichum cereale]
MSPPTVFDVPYLDPWEPTTPYDWSAVVKHPTKPGGMTFVTDGSFGGEVSRTGSLGGLPSTDGAKRRAHGRIPGTFSCLLGTMECRPLTVRRHGQAKAAFTKSCQYHNLYLLYVPHKRFLAPVFRRSPHEDCFRVCVCVCGIYQQNFHFCFFIFRRLMGI